MHSLSYNRAFDAYKCVRRGKDYKLLYNWVIFDMLLMMYQVGDTVSVAIGSMGSAHTKIS